MDLSRFNICHMLYDSVFERNTQRIKGLFNKCTNILDPVGKEETIFMSACKTKSPSVMKLLIELAGPRAEEYLNYTNYNGNILNFAAPRDKEIFNIVFPYVYDLNTKSSSGDTPLMLAVEKIHNLRLLLDAKALLDEQNNYGNTALIEAIISNSNEAAKLLIKAGADTEIVNFDGDNAYNIALMYGNTEIAKLLEKKVELDTYYPKKDETCPICLDNLSMKKSVSTRCRHNFHEDCLAHWRTKSNKCPNCRGTGTFFGRSRRKPKKYMKKSKKHKKKFRSKYFSKN